jgi:N6-adenosine-specific RNA methylase IME4
MTRYETLYADPPWGEMRQADIAAMKLPSAPNAALFLWSPGDESVPLALEVMAQWGFSYRSAWAWLDPDVPEFPMTRDGVEGYAHPVKALLLIGLRGAATVPPESENLVYRGRADPTDAKPIAFAEMIEEIFPHPPRLEVFASGPRLGWDVWTAADIIAGMNPC